MTASISSTVPVLASLDVQESAEFYTRHLGFKKLSQYDDYAMPKPLDGKCQCGEVHYHVTGVPVTLFACHCTECQRQSSSAFGMALWVKDARVELLSGALTRWIRTLPSGRSMECSFCPNCGTRLFHQVLGQSEIVSIKPGTLDDISWLNPVGHIWTKSMQPWVRLDPESLCYEENPDSFSDLISAWAKSNHANRVRTE